MGVPAPRALSHEDPSAFPVRFERRDYDRLDAALDAQRRWRCHDGAPLYRREHGRVSQPSAPGAEPRRAPAVPAFRLSGYAALLFFWVIALGCLASAASLANRAALNRAVFSRTAATSARYSSMALAPSAACCARLSLSSTISFGMRPRLQTADMGINRLLCQGFQSAPASPPALRRLPRGESAAAN
jgi:hypothetical protein